MTQASLDLPWDRQQETPANLTVIRPADEACRDFDISDEPVLATLYASQRKHFWFISRNLVIASMMKRVGLTPPARLLEVGCGTGTVLSHLIWCGYRADGVEMHRKLADRAAQNCPQARIYCLDIAQPEAGVHRAAYDGVGLFDVLEHVADPALLLSSCADAARHDGYVVGTVPALMSLWSAMDEAGGHRRRYDRSSLRCDLEAAGLEIVLLHYFFQALVPPIWLWRRRLRGTRAHGETDRLAVARHGLKVPIRPINAMFRAACCGERAIGRFLPLSRLPGASLFFAARKRR